MLKNNQKNCIAVLNRGYPDMESYGSLINRNKHINDYLENKSTDILIFHEGNIIEEHQAFIKNKTPELAIKFIDISNIAFSPNKKDIVFTHAHGDLSYRHMCSFWFVDFFGVVENYDKLLRIDEDCLINTNIDNIFLSLDNHIFVTATMFEDHDFVTVGMNEFSINFIHKYKEIFIFKSQKKKKPNGPYTNLVAFSLQNIRNSLAFQQYKNEIDKSNMIYERRWGDLPLWGEAIHYIFGDESILIDKTIKYFHGSHGLYINK